MSKELAQERFITAYLSEKTIGKACKKAGISAVAYYEWLKDPAFSARLKDETNKTFFEAKQKIRKATCEAVDVLVALLKCKEINQRRLSAMSIIELAITSAEKDIEDRLLAIEKIVAERKVYK